MRDLSVARSRVGRGWSLADVARESFALIWLLADQGVFALSNFVVNVLFARWLVPADYGLFVLSFVGCTLLTVLHFGTMLEPLLVEAPRVEADRRRSYIVTLIIANLIMIVGASVMAGAGYAVAVSLQAAETGLAIIGAMVGGSFICALNVARRLCLVFLSTRISATIGLVYMTGVITTSYIVHLEHEMAWFDLWVIMSGWSLLCSTVIFCLLYWSLSGSNPYSLRKLWRTQWAYARYGLVTSFCTWARSDGLFLVLANSAGLDVVAQTRAVINIAAPMSHVLAAFYPSWLVSFSRDPSLMRLRNTLGIYCIGAGLLIALVICSYPQLVEWVYAGRFMAGAWLLPFYALSHAMNGVESVFSCFMKAVGALRRGYGTQVLGCLLALSIGIPLIPAMAEAGLIAAVLGSFTISAVVAGLLVWTRRVEFRVR